MDEKRGMGCPINDTMNTFWLYSWRECLYRDNTGLHHPANQSLQILSFGMAQIDGMVPGMSHSTYELNSSSWIQCRRENNFLKQVPTHMVRAREGEEETLLIQQTESPSHNGGAVVENWHLSLPGNQSLSFALEDTGAHGRIWSANCWPSVSFLLKAPQAICGFSKRWLRSMGFRWSFIRIVSLQNSA